MIPYLDKTKFIERYGTEVPEDKIDELLNRRSEERRVGKECRFRWVQAQ